MKKYASLYMQTEYSLLSSMLSLSKLKDNIDTYDYSSMAICDNGMHGAYKFYNLCVEKDIKPIIGLRLNITNPNFDNIVLLYAKDKEGYKSLMRISSKREISPSTLTKEFLHLNNRGILAIIPVFENELNIYFKNKEKDAIEKSLVEYLNIFEDVYFGISLQSNYERQYAKYFIDLGLKYNIKSVAINRSCYFRQDDIDAYSVLQAIDKNLKIDEKDIFDIKEEERDMELLSSLELEAKFQNYQSLVYNTNEISEKCNLVLDYKGYYFPKAIIDSKTITTSKEYLFELAKTGLNKRLKQAVTKYPNYITSEKILEYKNRLLYELSIIDKMGFNDYFLIVYDYVKYAKNNDIYVGPARGSAGGSLVSYSLGITDIDPIYFGLLFERFLNPERVGMPDIDVDFDDDRRNELISHLGERYGKNKVAHIITFGTFKAKLAIRDVSRILKLSEIKLKEIMKNVSSDMSIDYSLENSKELKRMYESDEEINKVINIAKKIESLPKNYSTHAAGIIMAGSDLCDYTPLQEGIDGLYQTQYEASDLEKIGLVKMDILGLRNLSIIKDVVKTVERVQGIKIDLKNIPLDDKQTYQEIAKGNTLGIFQLEGSGVTNVLRRLKASSIEDIVSATALYRPGPMEMIDSFIDRKFKKEKIEYLDKSMTDALSSTYGIIVYQEQIMLIASNYAGYTLGEADILRRAVSKKKAKVLEEERNKFVLKASKMGRDIKQANKVYDYIEKFASYGFNRSHAVAYAILAYQMAYLKTHYYKAFVCSLMSNCVGSITSLQSYINEARAHNVKVLSPSINKSTYKFEYSDEGIYYPLIGIKNIGPETVGQILEERDKKQFESYSDFVLRTKNFLNQKSVQMLVNALALDEFINKDNITRKYMVMQYNDVLQELTYSDILGFKVSNDSKKEEDYTFIETSEQEKEALGFNIKYNVFIKYQDLIKKYKCVDFSNMKEGYEYFSLFILKGIREITTKKNDLMAFVSIEDESQIMDGVIFSDAYNNLKHELLVGYVYIAKVKLDIRKTNDDVKKQIVISNLRKI